MSQYKITKKRLAEIIKEEYDAAMERTDEAHCGGDHAGNRDEKKKKPDDEATNESAGDWTTATMTDDAGAAYGVRKTKYGKTAPDEDDKDDKDDTKKKMKKESLDSIRTLIQQELKNL